MLDTVQSAQSSPVMGKHLGVQSPLRLDSMRRHSAAPDWKLRGLQGPGGGIHTWSAMAQTAVTRSGQALSKRDS